MRILIGLVLSTTIANSAYSADERGNGGDAVVCRNQGGETVSAESLDHYEARTQLGVEINAGFPADTILEAVQNVLDRIPDFDESRKNKYKTWANDFEEDANYLRGISLVDIPDSNHIAIPTGCLIEQLVVQRQPSLPRQKRYTLNQDIWDRLDDANKVSVILHEIIYREALELGHWNSINTRYVTARLLELSFAELSVAEYAALITEAQFPVEEVCEDISYITAFTVPTHYHTGRPTGPARVDPRDRMQTDLCYVAGSKVDLSEGTSVFLLSRPFNLPSDITEQLYRGPGLRFGLSYDFNAYDAFEEMTGTKLPGYSGLFEVGTDCHSFTRDNRGRQIERESCWSLTE